MMLLITNKDYAFYYGNRRITTEKHWASKAFHICDALQCKAMFFYKA